MIFYGMEQNKVVKDFLVPEINESSNIHMYCNYARMNPHEERCITCDRGDCKYKGNHTIIERQDKKVIFKQ